MLAGVGVSWYTWLEQGRDIKVSESVLDAVGRALQLTSAEREHLYLLAGLNPPRSGGAHGAAALVTRGAAVPPELRQLLDTWAPRPAILRDRHWHLLAINDAARVVLGYEETDHNCLFTFFTNERYRAMQAQWAVTAPVVVAAYRADAAHAPGDPEFDRVVAELSAVSPEFAELWARHDVERPGQTVKAIDHPAAGALVFDVTTLAVVARPDWYLELFNSQPGTNTAKRLEDLARVLTPTA